jgi:DNA-binding PadR family transcriptional regulator
MELPSLSAKEEVIIELLVARGEMYGLQLVEASRELKRGTVYVTLNRMLDKGYVEVSQAIQDKHEGGLPRRLYRATGYGASALSGWKRARAALTETQASPPASDMQDNFRGIEEELREMLLGLHKDGKAFEQLACLALEAVLGRRVWPARGGPQFGADMGTAEEELPVIRVECKRYKGRLNRRELLGEIGEAAQRGGPLDLWVLVTTSVVSERLENALTDLGARLGLGVEIIDLSSSQYCKLPRLFACAVEEVSRFVGTHLGESQERKIRSILSRIRSHYGSDEALKTQLIHATNLFDLVAQRARSDLQNLLSNAQESRTRLSQEIHNSELFIERKQAFEELERWYANPDMKKSLFILCGEEGVGKTWAIYPWLAKKCESETLLPIILPSSQAASMSNVVDAIATSISTLFPGTADASWRRRVERWFQEPTFLARMVLLFEGLNEQPGAPWRSLIEHIFEDEQEGRSLSEKDTQTRTRLPAIITSRSAFWREHFSHLEHWNTCVFEAQPFTYHELKAYLRLRDHKPEDFDSDLWELLKIPRFCDLAIKHHAQLLVSGEISKDRLLYEDWKDRCQRKGIISFSQESFQDLMIEIAEKATQSKSLYRKREIAALLPQADSEIILEELVTGGVFQKTSAGKLTVEPQRLYLALGLLLLEQLKENKDAPREELRELIASHFEPSGLDSHAPICAAAIFGATIDGDVEPTIILDLFATFFSLQNIQDSEWIKIRGFFPVFPDIYRQLAEQVVTEPDSPRKAWETVEWAYLKWSNEPQFHQVFQDHCQRWMSLLPFESPWARQNDELQAEYIARLEQSLGCTPEEGSVTTRGDSFSFVKSRRLDRLHNLGIDVLSARPREISPRILRAWALLATLQEYDCNENGVWWLVKFLEANSAHELTKEIRKMLEHEDPVWQKAAHKLAGMLPDQAAERLRESSSHESFSISEQLHAEDPCKTGFYLWRDEDCARCLERSDVDPRAKITNISSRSNDPEFVLPESCSADLVNEIRQVLKSLDGNDRHRSLRTSTEIDIEQWEMAFARWTPRDLASFSKQFISRFDTKVLEHEPEDEKELSSRRFRIELGSRRLGDVALILEQRDFQQLLKFHRAWTQRPALKRKNYSVSADLDCLESDLFRILLVLAEKKECAQLILDRSPKSFNDKRLMDVLPLELSTADLKSLWGRLFALSEEELLAKLVFLALDKPVLSASQRIRLTAIAKQKDRSEDNFIPFLALLSEDGDLVQALLEADANILFQLVSEMYWIPSASIPPNIDLTSLKNIPTPLLSYIVERRQNASDCRRFAQLLKEFVDAGHEEWKPSPFSLQRSPRSWCSFSYTAVQKTFQKDPQCLDYLLEKAKSNDGSTSPIEHSYWLYFSVCEYLLEGSSNKALPLLDSLIQERYVGNNNHAHPHGIISLMARWSQTPGISRRLRDCLDLCVTDAALQSFALSFKAESDSWLWDRIASDLASQRPILVARALTLAGFSHDADRAIELLNSQRSRTAWWLDTVRVNALSVANKASWSKYWFEEFLTKDDPSESWSRFRLFLRSVDRRFCSWVNPTLEDAGLRYRSASLKMRHLRANADGVLRKIEDFEKKQLAKNFCHARIEERIFPWMKQWRLSSKDQRQIISGED